MASPLGEIVKDHTSGLQSREGTILTDLAPMASPHMLEDYASLLDTQLEIYAVFQMYRRSRRPTHFHADALSRRDGYGNRPSRASLEMRNGIKLEEYS
jgi:hypothetical protein